MAANISQIQPALSSGSWLDAYITNVTTASVIGAVEAASQTYKAGVPLVNSSGKLQEASANPTAIIGISIAKATGVTNTPVPFYMPLPEMVFKITVDGALVASNAPGTGIPTNVTPWSTYGISKDAASGQWYLDSSKSGANQVATVIGYDPDQASVVNGIVYIRFLKSTTIWT